MSPLPSALNPHNILTVSGTTLPPAPPPPPPAPSPASTRGNMFSAFATVRGHPLATRERGRQGWREREAETNGETHRDIDRDRAREGEGGEERGRVRQSVSAYLLSYSHCILTRLSVCLTPLRSAARRLCPCLCLCLCPCPCPFCLCLSLSLSLSVCLSVCLTSLQSAARGQRCSRPEGYRSKIARICRMPAGASARARLACP